MAAWSSLPGEAACALYLCSVLVPVHVPVQLYLCPCSFPRLLSELPHAYLVPAAGKRRALPITGTHPMRVIRHTVPRPLLFRHRNPSCTNTTSDTCARQTIRQHGDCSCIVAARWRRDLRHRSEMMPDLLARCPLAWPSSALFCGLKETGRILPPFHLQHRKRADCGIIHGRKPARRSTS